MKYNVTIEEILSKTIQVETDSKNEAVDKAAAMYANEEIILTSEDYTGEPEITAETDRENSYETKIVLRGDRLRKYFPDVSMTPLEIEESVYSALEERRQRLEKAKQKAELFAKKEPVK